MQHFYWLFVGGIAGCSRPGHPDSAHKNREFDGAAAAAEDESVLLDRDLAWLRGQGIGAMLTLTETPLPAEVLERHGLDVLHLPIPDMTAPLPAQFQQALEFIDWQRALGRAVAVHCLVGQGRTATILAAYLIRGGIAPDEAIAELRRLFPGAIGSPEQERALHRYAARRDWIV